MKDFDDWYPDHTVLSDCCGVPFNEDYGICPECKDHCEGVKFDEEGNEITQES